MLVNFTIFAHHLKIKSMKYRKLTLDELAELESEFIRFLASNTITGPDWQKLKTEDPEKANGLIEIFSDIVFDKIIKGVEYLEVRMPQDYRTFHCPDDKIKMLGIQANGSTDFDFTKNESPGQMMDQIQKSGAQLKLYSAEKAYQPNREQEVFRMMESGALISKDGAMYKALESLKN
jgi:hypothetical protein